jgi:hypothetical protein
VRFNERDNDGLTEGRLSHEEQGRRDRIDTEFSSSDTKGAENDWH